MHRRTLLCIPALLPSAASRAQMATPSPVPVVASFSILGDMLASIAGPFARVGTIIGPDGDAHGFAPRPSDQRILQASRGAFANGLGFDPWMDRMVRATNFRGPYVKVADGVTPRSMRAAHRHDDGGGRTERHAHAPRVVADPHAWQDLGNAPVFARAITEGLVRVLPAEAAAIEARAREFIRAAAETDAWVRAEIATVPPARRKVLTGHDAFGHFAAAYGVTFLAPQGVSTEAEPSAAEVARLIRQVRAENIRAVFMENMTSPRLLEQIAREAGVRILGRLYADALSGPDGPAPTWFAMFRHNVTLMVRSMLQ